VRWRIPTCRGKGLKPPSLRKVHREEAAFAESLTQFIASPAFARSGPEESSFRMAHASASL
jgi:hypothetical protein